MAATPKRVGQLKVEYRAIGTLIPYARNARRHSDEQVGRIADLIKRFGWTAPILVDGKSGIIAGHGRVLAAKLLNMRQVPAIELKGLSEAEKRAYILADNKVAEDAGWDKELLRLELGDLRNLGIDIQALGFGPKDFRLEPEDPPEPELTDPAVARRGDIWTLGNHALVCADSTKAEAYHALGRERVAMIFTDPPYGVSYEARSGDFEMIRGDDLRRGQLQRMLHLAFALAAKSARDDASWYVWHAHATREDFAAAMRDVGLVELGYIIWAKPQISLGWSNYRWAHEPCFYACRQGVRPAWYGDADQGTVWRVAASRTAEALRASIGQGVLVASETGGELYVTTKPPENRKVRQIKLAEGKTALLSGTSEADDLWEVSRDNGHGKKTALHPNQKPVELARRAILNSSREGERVLDMFAGSSSTLLAAEQTKRVAFAVEMDPRYVDAGIRRWQAYTGRQAILSNGKEHGKPFDAVQASRLGRTTSKAQAKA